MLPDEILLSLDRQLPCRELQLRRLGSLAGDFSPPILVLHGVAATGKSLTIRSILEAIDTPSAIVRSQECITTRHLLERTATLVKDSLEASDGVEEGGSGIGRCESISAFVVELQQLLEGKGQFILVFDGIDRQREAAPTLLPALARLSEIVRLSFHIPIHPI